MRSGFSDVAFFVHSTASGRTYWFLFDRGSGYYIHLISTTDVTAGRWAPPPADGGVRPLGEMIYLAADRDLRFSLDFPGRGKPAPAYILLPDLPEKLWYRLPGEQREHVPLAFFRLTHCLPETPGQR